MHISSLKSRKTAGVETEEKLESLRQKQEEIQARERKLKQDQENFKDEMRRKADDLDAREVSFFCLTLERDTVEHLYLF